MVRAAEAVVEGLQVTATRHPWDGIVPEADIASFREDREFIDRPIAAGNRLALLVIDMTWAFVDDRYFTGWSETALPAATQIRRLLDRARALGVPVFFTKNFAAADYAPTAAERGLWKMGTRRPPDPSLPPGDVIIEELVPIAGEVVIHKGAKASAFFGTPLASLLIHARVDTVIVTGMTTSGCVRATALDAFQHNLHVVVPHECCADRSQVSHAVSLFDLHMKYADVASTDAVLAYLDGLLGQRIGHLQRTARTTGDGPIDRT